jgi:SAM-dependent methyltransferase
MIKLMLKYLVDLEKAIDTGLIAERESCLQELRRMGISRFSEFMFSLPQQDFPNLSRILPTMASSDVQMNWTGAHGSKLLQQSLDFTLLTAAYFTGCTGKSLKNASILDFGCGYGRLLRLFLFFTSETNLYGVDPLQVSLDECRHHGLSQNLYLSDYLPTTLPFPHRSFSLIYSFSVFTHLSEQAAFQCLTTLYYYLDANGLLIITIRPAEFWLTPSHVSGCLKANKINPETLVDRHMQGEYVFFGSGGAGHETYGDASFDISWLTSKLHQYRVAFVDQSLSDPMQLYVGLMKN